MERDGHLAIIYDHILRKSYSGAGQRPFDNESTLMYIYGH